MADMIADALTKPLMKDRHLKLMHKMGLETLHHHQHETQRRKPQKVRVMDYFEASDSERHFDHDGL